MAFGAATSGLQRRQDLAGSTADSGRQVEPAAYGRADAAPGRDAAVAGPSSAPRPGGVVEQAAGRAAAPGPVPAAERAAERGVVAAQAVGPRGRPGLVLQAVPTDGRRVALGVVPGADPRDQYAPHAAPPGFYPRAGPPPDAAGGGGDGGFWQPAELVGGAGAAAEPRPERWRAAGPAGGAVPGPLGPLPGPVGPPPAAPWRAGGGDAAGPGPAGAGGPAGAADLHRARRRRRSPASDESADDGDARQRRRRRRQREASSSSSDDADDGRDARAEHRRVPTRTDARPAPAALRLPPLRAHAARRLRHRKSFVEAAAASESGAAAPRSAAAYIARVAALLAHQVYYFPGLGLQAAVYLAWLTDRVGDRPVEVVRAADSRARQAMSLSPRELLTAPDLDHYLPGGGVTPQRQRTVSDQICWRAARGECWLPCPAGRRHAPVGDVGRDGPAAAARHLAQGEIAPTPIDPVILTQLCHAFDLWDDRAARVIDRFIRGADLGFGGQLWARFSTNNRSALALSDAVSAAIRAEVAVGVTRGPFPAPPFNDFRVNPLSARAKPGGAARVILDLSRPHGASVNDAIDPDQFPVQYPGLDDLAALIYAHGGAGTLLFKADVKAAFKLIPVRPDQHHALGFCWEQQFWYQTALPFGCRSSPSIFNEFAGLLRDLLRRMAGNEAVLNYLDDFFGIEQPGVSTYGAFLDLCAITGVPLQPHKCVPPSTRVEILGVVVNTSTMCFELPAAKLQALTDQVAAILGRRRTTRRALLSVVGLLAHACRCVPPGRGFMRRLLDAAYTVERPLHRVRVTQEVRADLRWWAVFAPLWNGRFPILPPVPGPHAGPTLATDSSRHGMGAVLGGAWWMAEWPGVGLDENPSMTLAEFLPVLVAAVTWDHHWRGERVLIFSDNMGVVGAWGRGWAKEPRTMCILRHLLFRAALGGYHLEIRHVPGRENGPADALSRGDLAAFRRFCPQAHTSPSPLPRGWEECVRDPVGGTPLLTGVQL